MSNPFKEINYKYTTMLEKKQAPLAIRITLTANVPILCGFLFSPTAHKNVTKKRHIDFFSHHAIVSIKLSELYQIAH